tara:strand:+ start:950 stop:1207 length:258 start_codon:yes stop_codon:yes gene_type:complete
MTKSISNKKSKQTARTINYAKTVVEVGEVLSIREIMGRLNSNIPSSMVPRSTNQLSARLKTHPHVFAQEQVSELNERDFVWRRIQ